MIKKYTRLWAFVIAVLMICQCFTACSEDSDSNTETDGEVTSSETTASESEPPAVEKVEAEFMTLTTKTITTDMLAQTGNRSQRWLSIPESRLVLNPLNFGGTANEVTHPEYADSPDLPLNMGYLDPYTTTGTGIWMEDMLMTHETPENLVGGIEMLWEADFAGKWSKSGGKYTIVEPTEKGGLSITVQNGADAPWQYVAQKIDIDLDLTPMLTVTIDSCGGTWALKLCENGKQDVVIQGDSNKTGTFTYDIAKTIGQTGRFKGQVKLFSVGYEKTLEFSRLDIALIGESRNGTAEQKITWYPHQLAFEASYPDGLALTGFDTFADLDTVLRTVKITNPGRMSTAFRILGKVTAADANSVTVDCGTFSYTVFSSKDAELIFYRDSTSCLANYKPGESWQNGWAYGCFEYGDLEAGCEITVSISCASDANEIAAVAANAEKYSSPEAAKEALAAREAYWNDYLTRVPQPQTFKFRYVDALGVTEEYTEQMYYIAWVFMAQNLLRANPEVGFNYRQVCCGKPSMWAYGDPLTTYTASWESFFGMMYLGYTMPDEAWDAYIGLMTLVDDEGLLAGESLPSEKAHTGYLLYQLTGDTEKLNSVYDNIARYLKWRVKNPRWIYLEHNNPDQADADFAESALVDIKYMIEIARVTGREDDIPMWEEIYNDHLEMYRIWFFDDAGNAYQYSSKSNPNNRALGNTIWTSKGMLVDGLGEPYTEWIFDRFAADYDIDKAFCGFDMIKHPDTSHTIYGLIKCGYEKPAIFLTETCARDMLRVGMFSENYHPTEYPAPSGVRPSIFGCAMLIDCVLMMNGYMSSDGQAMVLNLFGDGGVVGIRMDEGIFSFALDAEANAAKMIIDDKEQINDAPICAKAFLE
ncbi:MAG: hypothetical protein J6I45_08180 [Clostridia bacterium]|nr:hypothetical protein [Clostridia bacterium]